MSASSIPAGRAGGYAEYLESKTVEPERGDYYLTPQGEMAEAPGQWLTDRDTLEGLGVDPDRPVEHGDFKALMEGRHPGSGDWLRAAGAGGERGGGIDATFSAPKSVSVAWALADAWQREGIEQAHAEAVERAIQYMRENVSLVRARHGGEVVEEPAKDVIAAEFRHTTARGVDGAKAPDPQLHSHVVITGAIREDDRPVAVASRPVFRSAREVGAYYRSALAEGLSEQGYEIEQNTGKDERYFEIKGVPEGLREELSGRSKEVARAAERFRAEHGRAPENGELRNLALENRRSKVLTTRSDLQQAWQETAQRYDFTPEDAMGLLTQPEQPPEERIPGERILEKLTEHHAIFDARELHAVALEQTTGDLSPEEALNTAEQLLDDHEILTLEDGKMTTLDVRAREEAIERRTENLAQPAGRDVGDTQRENAAGETAERIGAPLSDEQQNALQTLTGPERAATLIGQAGTGKGVVIDTAARAEQRAGHQTIGVAVSGSTAERLGHDSPALEGQTMTLDALVARADAGSLDIGEDTTVFLDEAGMVDHHRLDALTSLIEESGGKLVAVGDGQQLPAIGPGGMFDRIAEHTPTAELTDIYRTQDPGEQQAWQALRDGNPQRALEHYQEQGQLHMADTRDQAGEAAVQHWHALAQEHGLQNVALIADASNQEIDRLNARAQHLRGQHGEIGHEQIEMESKHYGLHQGDRVAFTTQHHPQDEPRIENGTRGEITHLDPDKHQATIAIDGSDRHVTLAGEDLESLRLAYAEHIYRQQGATVDRSIVLTGGWQTSKESSYVEASRAREGTDWYLARDELGTEGQDQDRVQRLATGMSQTRAQTPSLDYQPLPDPADHLNPHHHDSTIPEHHQDHDHPGQDQDQERAR